MLTLQKTDNNDIVSMPVDSKNIDNLLAKEWLLTNERGSYASSTIVGCNTRRYHGLLIGSLNPPANRIMTLANCLEMVIINGEIFNLSTFEFSEKLAPEGFAFLKRFRRDTGAHFEYQLPQLQMTKSLYLLRDTDTIALVYGFAVGREPIEFVIRPFIGLRDFHTLQKSYAHLSSSRIDNGLLVRHDMPGSCELFFNSSSMNFEKDEQWWFNFVYRSDRGRGQDFTEDLWTPGFFKSRIDSRTKIVFWANFGSSGKAVSGFNELKADVEKVRDDLRKHQQNLMVAAGNRNGEFRKLCLAADQFITKRRSPEVREPRTTILAGFPWFADWGRDAFISLPGLLLSTGRFDEAKSVLTTFAAAADEGMIPNRFDDYSDTAYFNSIDASLWFINAAFRYLEVSGDSETFKEKLLPVILCIIDFYRKGTRFDIHADTDGLLTAGNEQTQLTWMDAKYEGVASTSRYGKAVEINALWYNSLCWMAQFYERQDEEQTKHYRDMADKVKESFCTLFWNEDAGYLYDCILPDGSADASFRPNQIFAVSLPFSPLSPQQQQSVVDAVQKNLLTPFGLRTLNPQDSRYKGKYKGPQKQRDEAYHQGTVWPYLIGPFVESYLKVNGFSRKSKKQAVEFVKPLLKHMAENGCLGQLCEIFDGDEPHKPRGCVAQAWSIAELIRAYRLVNS